MITEQTNYDLRLLPDLFNKIGDYTEKEILDELHYWREHTDFLLLVSENDDGINGYIVGYRNRRTLWIYDIWRKQGLDLATSNQAFNIAKDWARARGMTSIAGETKRNKMRAMKRYGFEEKAVVIECQL